MGMAKFGLRNLFRSRMRLAVVALLIGFPFFLLLVMQGIGDAVERQTELLKRTVDNTLQLRARGSMGHVNMVGSSDVVPGDVLSKVRSIEHVHRVEPYALAMTPTEGHNFAMIVGLDPGDTKRLESHGEAGNPRIIAGRDLTPEDRSSPSTVRPARSGSSASTRAATSSATCSSSSRSTPSARSMGCPTASPGCS